MGLGIPGPEVAAKSKLDPSTFFGVIDQVVQKYPQVKIVATTLHEVNSINRHSWGAVTWIDGKTYVSPTWELDILDRVGGGMATRPGSSTACSQVKSRKKQSTSAEHTARC